MVKRTKIGLVLSNDDLGVVYYILNVVKCLHFLKEKERPHITLLYTNETEKYKDLFEFYTEMSFELVDFPNLITYYLKAFFLRRNYFLEGLCKKHQLVGLFPVLDIPVRSKEYKLISWVTDFQHKFYPKFFKKINLILREFRFKQVLANSDGVVLSSLNAKSHVYKFYSKISSPIHVLNFVSHIEINASIDKTETFEKYGIDKPFFIISNQFYTHKNHITVLRAIKDLITQGNHEFDFVFTGKTQDYRNKGHYDYLLNFISENSISERVKILGMIDRADQIFLMKEAEAIIQPSLFEGWNTSIEDAKKIGQTVICSDLDVHKEQLGKYGVYFDPNSSTELTKVLLEFNSKNQANIIFPNNHEQRVRKFANGFIALFYES